VSVCPVVVVVVVLLSIHPSHHPSRSSKLFIPEEEDDGTGGRQRRKATAMVDHGPSRLSVRASEGARECLSDGSYAMATMATNKELLRIFPLLWN